VLLAADTDAELYGLEIIRASGLTASTIYPILQRLLSAGWVTSRWESEEVAQEAARPPRRCYQLTVEGRARATNALDSAAQRRNLARLIGLPDPLRSARYFAFMLPCVPMASGGRAIASTLPSPTFPLNFRSHGFWEGTAAH
jgi:PadR family transcriptional regulator, regulatory protein PadR